MPAFRNFGKRSDELIVIHDYAIAGGVTRSVYNYYKHKLSEGNNRVAVVKLVNKNSFLKLLYYAFFSGRIIINGLACFRHWPVFLVCYLRNNLVIYLHEAAPHVGPFARQNPVKFKLLLKLLRKRRVAFVSEWQQQYFLKLTEVPRKRIIYNNMNFPFVKRDQNQVTVGMIGYQSKYKNASFFSKVADEAANRGLPYQFVWIGGEGGEMKEMYHSKNVLWAGDQEHVMDTLNSVDILLFTSYGDTFGLVLTEALFKAKRIVSYVENGLTPFLGNLKGCRIYNRFDEKQVLDLVSEVLLEQVDPEEHKALAYSLCSMENFEKRLDELFAI